MTCVRAHSRTGDELLRPQHRPATKQEAPADLPAEAELVVPKPRLVSDQPPAFSVAEFVEERIKACKGGKVAFRDVYRDYEATAQRRSEHALDPEQFTASLAKLCEGTSVYARETQGTVYLINVRFASVESSTLRRSKAKKA